MLHSSSPAVYELIPVLCMIECETTDPDLRQDAVYTLACMAQTQVDPQAVPRLLHTLNKVCA